jgi:hypothetical protein
VTFGTNRWRSLGNVCKHRSMERSGVKCFHCTHVFDLTNLKGEKRRNVGKLNNELNIVNRSPFLVVCKNYRKLKEPPCAYSANNHHWLALSFREQLTHFYHKESSSPHPAIVPKEGAVLFELRRAILLSPQCGDTTSCIRHLVSDRRLSLISKENVYNVRQNRIL